MYIWYTMQTKNAKKKPNFQAWILSCCHSILMYLCPVTSVRAAQRWDWLLAIQFSFKNTFSKEFWESVLCIYYVLFYRLQQSYGFNVTILHLFYFFQSISWHWCWASDLLHLSLTRNIVWLRPCITGILLYVFRFMGLPEAWRSQYFSQDVYCNCNAV